MSSFEASSPPAIKSGFWHKVMSDFDALGTKGRNPFVFLVYLIISPGFLAVFMYRLSALLVDLPFIGVVLAKMSYRLNAFISGCEIAPRAQIGAGLHIPHPCGIVIGFASIGSNVRILQNVTIGSRHQGDDSYNSNSYPTIEDDVVIGAGAVLIGPIRIGCGAQIGANAVVLEDVPAFATAVGVPARLVLNKNEAG